MRTLDVISKLPRVRIEPLPPPEYTGTSGQGIALAVQSMIDHTSDEGWQLMLSLRHAGYSLCGYNLRCGTNVPKILQETNPGVVVVQDKREWDKLPRDFRDPHAFFTEVRELKRRTDIFKLTILKDSHQKPPFHKESAHEMSVHAWIVYYHPKVVQHLASFTRPQHLIRIYHTLDSSLVPEFNTQRRRCILSGAVSSVYPLRERLIKNVDLLPDTDYLKHPGYHRRGSSTPKFLRLLDRYKVSICTASIYGYALRKIIESTACGCIVLTDLPSDEVMPEIDGNLVRISPDLSTEEIADLILSLYSSYDYDKQKQYADMAKAYYDYRISGFRLVSQIEEMRKNYAMSVADYHKK